MSQMIYLCNVFQGKHIKFGLWCNGSTTGFGSVCPGSNPGSPTEKALRYNILELFNFRPSSNRPHIPFFQPKRRHGIIQKGIN